MLLIKQPDGAIRLGDWLLSNFCLSNPPWSGFQAIIAFVKASGVRYIVQAVRGFIERGGNVKFVVGIDHRGTSFEGLRMLLDCVGDHGEIWITHNLNFSTFHPKIYIFERENRAVISVGSGNLTEGGLYTNYEAGVELNLNLEDSQYRIFYESILQTISEWSNPESGISRRLDEELLARLIQSNMLPIEIATTEADEAEPGNRSQPQPLDEGRPSEPPLFRRIPVRRPPQPPLRIDRMPTEVGPAAEPSPLVTNPNFVMTLQKTDVGTGQITPGTSRRSPEIFIPLKARNANPGFWGWPDAFTEDSTRPGKWDRIGVKMRIGGQNILVNMMTWPVKHDFRLRSETLRSAGNVSDILRLEKVSEASGFSYYVEIIPKGTSQYEYYLALCNNPTKNSLKIWGYF
jgi:hypothetical protein